jgi:hypothetical protein
MIGDLELFKGPKQIRTLAGLFLLGLCVYTHGSGQTIASKLEQTGEFDSKSTTLRGQLVDFAQRYGIPMGIELGEGSDKSIRPIHIESDTAAEVLRRIVRQGPGYDFDLGDGVVNVYSVRLVNDYKNFLNLRVRSYDIKEEDLSAAQNYLQLAINRTLHPNLNYGGGWGGVRGDSLDIGKISFSGDNLTVRQILNRLIAIHGGALWVVQLKPSRIMTEEPFYAQILPGTDISTPEFFWQFVPVR